MRRLLRVGFFVCLLGFAGAAWGEVSQQELLAPTPEEKPRVEQTVCVQCHTSSLMKEEYKPIPGEWRQSIHYKNGVSCNDCHGGNPKDAALAMKPESGFLGKPKPGDVPEFCGKCHVGIMQSFLESGHGKALKATGRGPNCILCHHSHNVQKASINIINENLCGVCHTYDRARTMKAALLLTEQKINEIDKNLRTLKAGLIDTGDEEKTLFGTQAEYRTLFHTVDVSLVQSRTAEFNKRLAVLNAQVQKGFQELKFRQNFAILILLILVGLGIALFFLRRKS